MVEKVLDTVIRNARIYDGTGRPWFTGQVGVLGEKIEALWRSPCQVPSREIIEGQGLALCPGIIDVHGHSDFTILSHPGADNLVAQGITTQVVGQCGFSMYAFLSQYVSQVKKTIQVTAGESLEQVDWKSLDEWRQKVQARGTRVNLVPLIGHNTLRCSVLGPEADVRVELTRGQARDMRHLLHQGLEDGAFGLSTGLRYPYGRNATTEEVIDLCHCVAQCGGVHMSHLRSEEEYLLPAVHELIQISEQTGVPGCASHFKALFPENWGTPAAGLRALEEARSRGVNVVCDVYPWTFARQINLGAWFGGPLLTSGERVIRPKALILSLLQDPIEWRRIKSSLIDQNAQLEIENRSRKDRLGSRGIFAPCIWRLEHYDCVTHSPSHGHFEGHTLGQITRALDLSDPWETMRLLYLADDGFTQVAAGPVSPSDVESVIRHPLSMFGTDASSLDTRPSMDDPQVSAHPRAWGTYPKILGDCVRQRDILCWEEAIAKCTSFPASFLGITDRGLIKPGFWADLVLFDPASVANRATYAQPAHSPEGIKIVMVNGQKVWDQGVYRTEHPGRVLSR